MLVNLHHAPFRRPMSEDTVRKGLAGLSMAATTGRLLTTLPNSEYWGGSCIALGPLNETTARIDEMVARRVCLAGPIGHMCGPGAATTLLVGHGGGVSLVGITELGGPLLARVHQFGWGLLSPTPAVPADQHEEGSE